MPQGLFAPVLKNAPTRRSIPYRCLALLAAVVLVPCVLHAQDTPRVVVDSLDHVQDSVIAAANTTIAHDSTKVEEYQKILAIYKARKRFVDELDLATQMAVANPTSALAFFAVGDAHLDNGTADSAVVAFATALKIDPAFVRVRVTLAEAYTMLQSLDTALMYLNSAVQLNPRYAQAHVQRALLLSKMGRDSDAIESYRAAADLLPDSFQSWMRLARAQMKISQYEEAIVTAQYAMSLNPQSSDPVYLLGEAYLKLNRNSQAAETFEAFMLRFPTDRRALEAERIARELKGQ